MDIVNSVHCGMGKVVGFPYKSFFIQIGILFDLSCTLSVLSDFMYCLFLALFFEFRVLSSCSSLFMN